MIIIISSSHYPDDERIYHRQIKSLSFKKKEILYITRSSSKLNLTDQFIKHKNFDLLLPGFLEACKKLIIEEKSTNYLQIHETNLLPLIKFTKLFKSSVKTIYDIHEDMDSLYRTFSERNFFVKEISIFFRKKQEEYYLKYVDTIILANPYLGVEPYANHKVKKLVSENFPEKKYIFEDLQNRIKPISIIYHGHLAPERGILDLIQAMEQVVEEYPEAKLVIVGSFRTNTFKVKVNSLISSTLKKNIIIKNQIPYDQIWEILRNSSIGVIPFRKTPLTENNTPTKLFEMMASGLAIVSSDLRPIKYFVKDTIYWSQPSNPASLAKSILASIDDENVDSKINKNLELIMSKYNWERIEDSYTSLFN